MILSDKKTTVLSIRQICYVRRFLTNLIVSFGDEECVFLYDKEEEVEYDFCKLSNMISLLDQKASKNASF